jgi:hypothetical protein
MSQNSITIITSILCNHMEDLKKVLAILKADIGQEHQQEFEKLNKIHFARWVVIENDHSGANGIILSNPRLIFIADFDGTTDDFLEELCEVAHDLIDRIYEFCEGYPALPDRVTGSRIEFFNRFSVKDTAVYSGAPGRSLQQIRDEDKLTAFIKNTLNSTTWKDVSPDQIHQIVRQRVLDNPDFAWIKQPANSPRVNWLGMIGLSLILLIVLPFIIVWILIIHFIHEKKDRNFTLKRSELDSRILTKLETYEDYQNQNQFTQLVEMKPGNMRLLTIKGVFLFSRTLINFIFVEGKLMGIPTIHFAKWVLFDDDKKVLFFSNFDGSWQQYLGDFIDKSGWGLTGIFSNTAIFPKTNFLFTGGAYDEEHFLAWSRHTEIPTNVWFSAYPELSIKNINNNSRIRMQLMKHLSKRKAAKFLRLL